MASPELGWQFFLGHLRDSGAVCAFYFDVDPAGLWFGLLISLTTSALSLLAGACIGLSSG